MSINIYIYCFKQFFSVVLNWIILLSYRLFNLNLIFSLLKYFFHFIVFLFINNFNLNLRIHFIIIEVSYFYILLIFIWVNYSNYYFLILSSKFLLLTLCFIILINLICFLFVIFVNSDIRDIEFINFICLGLFLTINFAAPVYLIIFNNQYQNILILIILI